MSTLIEEVWDDAFTHFHTTMDTGTGALSLTVDPNGSFILDEVRVHLDGAVVEVENLTITLDADEGAEHDAQLCDPVAMATKTDHREKFTEGPHFDNGDKIVVAFANTDGNTWGVTVKLRKKPN
jgi:hypothetical protein